MTSGEWCICFMCFCVAMNAQKILKFNIRLLFGDFESWIFEGKKMKSKWVNGANAGCKSHAFVQSNSKLIFGVCIGQWH